MIKFFDKNGAEITDGHATAVIIVPGMLAPQTVRVPLYIDGELRSDVELLELGVTVVSKPQEMVDGEKVIAAAYDLVSLHSIASVMTDPASIKDALAGLAMLTTKKAPDGMIDLLDPLVPHWFSLAGITLDQVREAIKTLQ